MGRLPRDVRRRDLEDFFKDAGFAKAVKDITLKTGFAFIVSIIVVGVLGNMLCVRLSEIVSIHLSLI